jgi:phage protein U
MSSPTELVVGTASVRRGKLFINHRRLFDQLVAQLDERWTLEVVVKRLRANRSIQANRYYWGVVLATLSAHTGYTVDELHDLMKMKFIPKHLALLDGNGDVQGAFVLGGSTRQMTTKEFADYIEAVRQFAGAELDCYIPDAGDV